MVVAFEIGDNSEEPTLDVVFNSNDGGIVTINNTITVNRREIEQLITALRFALHNSEGGIEVAEDYV